MFQTVSGPKKAEEVKDKGSGASSSNVEKAVRDSVRRSFAEALKGRVAVAKDLEVSDAEIDELALKIEERMYKLFDSKTDMKYKSKYRTLHFNIKDTKNETLYRYVHFKKYYSLANLRTRCLSYWHKYLSNTPCCV